MTTALFRIAQEILTNVARHANASSVVLNLAEEEGWIILEGNDNGTGITEEQANNPTSLGLLGMKERVHHLGGTCTIQGRPHKGTIVSVRIPVE